MLTVACVLKHGPEYGPEHVAALAAGVRRHLAIPHRIVCLTDMPGSVERIGVEPVLLEHGWPGWWSKIELFRPGLFKGPVLYADLDTVIVSNIDDMVEGHRFTVLRSFWVRPGHPRIGSGLMAWNEDLSRLYRRFAEKPETVMAVSKTTENWGDQGFIQGFSPVRMERWQDKFPGRVISYKLGVMKNDGRVTVGTSIVCYHGKPRPWDTPLWHLEKNAV